MPAGVPLADPPQLAGDAPAGMRNAVAKAFARVSLRSEALSRRDAVNVRPRPKSACAYSWAQAKRPRTAIIPIIRGLLAHFVPQ